MGLGRRIGNLYVSLGLNTTAFNQGFKEASKALDQFKARTEKNKLTAFTHQIGLTTKSIRTLESTAKMAIGSLAAGVGVMGLKSLVDIADKYTLLEGRLRLVTKSSQELASVQASLYQISQRTRTDYSATADLYTQLARSTESLELKTGQLLQITESVNKALIVSGASSESSNAALIQLGQGMASGTLRGEELNSVMEQTPRLARMIADGLGITIGQLRQYGKEGKLTAEMVTQALLSQAQAIDKEFQQMGTTVSQAMTELKNAFESVAADSNNAADGTDSLAGSIEDLAKIIEVNKPGIIGLFVNLSNVIGSAIENAARLGNVIGKIPGGIGTLIAMGAGGRVAGVPGALISGGAALSTSAVYDFMKGQKNFNFAGIRSKSYGSTASWGTGATGSWGDPELSGSYINPIGKIGKTGSSGSSSVSKAERERQKAESELTKKIEEARAWYDKEFESITGHYEATIEATKSLERLDTLLNAQIISEEKYIAAVDAVSMKYHEALLGGTYDQSAFNLGIYASGSDKIANNRGIDALRSMENLMSYSGIRISGWDKFEASYTALSEYFSPENQAAKGAKEYAGLYKGLAFAAAGIGEAFGGQVGNALSSTLSGVMAGAGFGPVGAVIGGVVGLVSSIFGGDDEAAKAQRDDMRRQVYDNMINSALSGGTESLMLLKQANWNYDTLSNLPDYYPNNSVGEGARLLGDRGVTHLETLQEVLNVLDQAGQTVNQFMSSSMLMDLETAANLLDYSVAQVGDLAKLTAAYQAQQIMVITGLNADIIGSFITDAVSTGVTGEAGKAFSEKLEESIAESIRQMAISTLVTNSIMPLLQPALTALVTGLMTGTLTSVEMASLYGNVKSVTSQIAPMVTALAEAFDIAGIGLTSGTGKALSTSSYASYAEYALASAGVSGFAAGGSFQGGWRIVGEYGPELEYTGPSRIYSNARSRELFDTSRLEAEIAALRAEIQASNYAIAKNTARTALWLEKWEKDGLPKETIV